MKNTTILVTVGCGFIGANFIIKLFKYKLDVVVIDNFSTGLKKNLSILKKEAKKKKVCLEFYKFDLCNKKKLSNIFKKYKFKYVFHFAAFSSVRLSLQNPKKVMNNNVKSTKNLINLINKYDVKKFVFSSSASLYGNIKFKKNIKESSKLKPINPYGYSKLLNEKTIVSKSKKRNYDYCIFRYFNVVGKHVSMMILKKKNLNLFDTIYFAVKNEKTFFINGKNLNTIDGTPVRDFICIDDVVDAHLECIIQTKNKKFFIKIYNVGINKGITVLQIIKTYNKLFKNKIKYKFIDNQKGEIEKSIADNSKFLRLSNWKPKFTKTNKIVKFFFK